MKSTAELKELRNRSSKDLVQDLQKYYKKLRDGRFSAQFRKDKNVKTISKTKKTIARIWTILSEKLTAEQSKLHEKNNQKQQKGGN